MIDFNSKKPPYRMVWTTITPEIAEELLETQKDNNRSLSMTSVTKFSRNILMGQWISNIHQPIAITPKGELLDGQHRCKAVSITGIPIDSWVAIGVPKSVSVGGIDRVGPRNLRDHIWLTPNRVIKRLTKKNRTRARDLAGITGCMYFMITGERGPEIESAIKITKHYLPSIMWAMDALMANKVTRKVCIASAFVFIHDWAAKQGDEMKEALEDIAEKVKSGENLTGPALLLREYVREEIAKKGPSDSEWVMFHRALRALETSVTGEPLKKLQTPNASRMRTKIFGKTPQDKEDELSLLTLKRARRIMEARKASGSHDDDDE